MHQIIDQMLATRAVPGSPSMAPMLALMHLGLGDKEKFYFYFEEAMREKAVTILFFYNSPFFEDVNGEERIKLLRRKYRMEI